MSTATHHRNRDGSRRSCQLLIALVTLLVLCALGAPSAMADAVYNWSDELTGPYSYDFNVNNGGWTNNSSVGVSIGGLVNTYVSCGAGPQATENYVTAALDDGWPTFSGTFGASIGLSPGVNYPGCAVIAETVPGSSAINLQDPNDFEDQEGADFGDAGGYAVGYDPTSSQALAPSLNVGNGAFYGNPPTLSATAVTGQGGDPVSESCTVTDLANGQQQSFSSTGTGSATATSSDPYTGSQTLACGASNGAGTTSPTTSVTFGVDYAPSVTITGPTDGEWYATAQTITVNAVAAQPGLADISCTDNGSTLDATSSSINGSEGTAAFQVDQNGANSIVCRATDNDNLTGTSDTTVDLDTTAPNVSFSGAVFNEWVDAVQTVTATAVVGPSGLDGGIYCATSGQSQQYLGSGTGTITVGGSDEGSGVYTVTCEVENNAGVTSTVTSPPIEIDEQTPTVSFSGVDGSTTSATDAAALAAGGTLTVIGTDPAPAGDSSWDGGSGISAIACQINGGGYATVTGGSYSLPINGSGQYVIQCRATNGVGTIGPTSSYYIDIDTATAANGQSVLVDSGQPAFSDGPSESAWYRDAQSITVTASLPDGDPVVAIDCGGAGVNEYDPNTSGTPNETVGVNVSAPGGTLTCTATDSGGNVYPLGSYVFNIDDTPPTGYFVGSDADSPALIRAAVADDQSGVASVTINALCESGPCLTAVQGGSQPASAALATSYNQADGYWEATIPDDGSLADGDYELIANASDAAGNAGQITAFASGATAGISLPARIVTTVDVTAAAGDDEAAGTTVADTEVPTLADAARTARTALAPDAAASATPNAEVCTVKTVTIKKGTKTRPAKTKLKRVCKEIKQVSSLTLNYGQKSTISGILVSQSGDSPLAGVSLQVEELASGQSVPTRLATVTTNSDGEFTYVAPAGPSRVLEVVYDGTTILRSAAAEVTEAVRGSSTLTAPKKLVAGNVATLSGRVKGGYIPPGGVQVQLWYTVAGSHVAFAPWTTTIHTNSAGRWRFTFRLAGYTAGHTYEFQVRLDKQYGWGFLSGKSRILSRAIQ